MPKTLCEIETMQIFGDKKQFAISYQPRPAWNTGSRILIYCHFVLNGAVIGNPDESDMMRVCISDLERLRNRVLVNQRNFRSPSFDELTEEEILRLIYKSNQLEDEYDPDFAYLPAFKTSDLWEKHTVKLAESTDQYAIVVFEENSKLKFIWQTWEEYDSKIKPRSVLVEYDCFLSAVESFQAFLMDEFSEDLDWFRQKLRTT